MADWITVQSASRKAGVSDRTIRNWIAKGRITAKKERGIWLIDPDSLTEIGKEDFQHNGKAEAETVISVPLERYEGLITRLAQLEVENQKYRLMLEAPKKKEPFWRRWLKKPGK